ncbi:MAG: pyrimidine/purine nucleoside phosphorylase [Burkholderiaceae bacterium]|jgi:uncharacterized protein YaiE (UPF0345 family)
MTTNTIHAASLSTKANVYFDGRCVSHSFKTASGEEKSVGVVLPSTLTFNTGKAEIMECVAGACEYRLKGQDQWHTVNAGEQFAIVENSSFEIKVSDSFHYICHYA